MNAGMDRSKDMKLTKDEYMSVVKNGMNMFTSGKANESTEMGALFGRTHINKEQQRTENNGSIKLPKYIENVLPERVLKQAGIIGSLGSGNHFLEVCCVEKVYDTRAADYLGLKKGDVAFMVHTGSRTGVPKLTTDMVPQKKPRGRALPFPGSLL